MKIPVKMRIYDHNLIDSNIKEKQNDIGHHTSLWRCFFDFTTIMWLVQGDSKFRQFYRMFYGTVGQTHDPLWQ